MADQLDLIAVTGPDGNYEVKAPKYARDSTATKIQTELTKLLKKTVSKTQLDNSFSKGMDGLAKEIAGLLKHDKKREQNLDKTESRDKKHQSKTQETQEALLETAVNNLNGLADLKRLNKANADASGGSLGDLSSARSPVGIAMQGFLAVGGAAFKLAKGLVAVVSTLALAVAKQVSKVFNMLNDSLSDGTAGLIGAFQGSAVNIAASATRAGLSLTNFLEALEQNSEEIMVLGAEGYAKLRTQSVDLAGGFFELGYSNEEVTKMLGREISIRARMGMQLQHGGRQLAEDVTEVAKELRLVGNRAGIAADALYEAAKLDDETNSLIAARAREMGDDGISALQTSIRKLSIRMAAISPTYAGAITNPLVNAIVTGAAGLDEGFVDLITVFPGMQESMVMAQRSIRESGELTDSTITDIMTNLADVSDDEFDRAKQMALMTRNQTAIQAVNFASEVRARRDLITGINNPGDLSSAALISGQASIFFDMMKAPFSNALSTFMIQVLGVGSGSDINFAAVVAALSTRAQDFVHAIPILGDVFREGGFIKSLNEQIQAFFNPDGTETERQEARKAISDLVKKMIQDLADHFREIVQAGTLGKELANFFGSLMDHIRIEVYESTGLGGGKAAMAYARRGDDVSMNQALNVDGLGLQWGSDIGAEVAQQIANSQRRAAGQVGIKVGDIANFLSTNPDGSDYMPLKKKMMSRYKMTEEEFRLAADAMREMNQETNAYLQQFGRKDTGKAFIGPSVFKNIIDESLGFKTSTNREELLRDISQRNSPFSNQMENYSGLSGFNRKDHGNRSMELNNIRRQLGTGGANQIQQAGFKTIVDELVKEGKVNLLDGINETERNMMATAYTDFLKGLENQNKTSKEEQDKLITVIKGLILNINPDST